MAAPFFFDNEQRVIIGESSSWTASFGDVPNILTDFSEWESWRDNRVAQFQSHCPSGRSSTYYFSQSGDDTSGQGTVTAPWKTLAKASAVIVASSGDVRCRFRRGDTWRESTGIVTDKNNITIDDYGTGALPIFDCFTVQHTSGWTNAAGNRWTKTEATDVAWIKINSDPYGESRGTCLIRLASSASVESTANSWFWDSSGTTLHVNLNGTDPNTLTIDVCPSSLVSGVEFQGDGCRAENIIGFGWGCHRTTNATQEQPFTNRTSGDDANLFIRCEGYYSGTHAMAHNLPSGSGGKSMWLDCVAGFTKYGSAGETVFNTYSAAGGQESWFLGCSAKYGTLKSSDFSYTNAGAAIAFYGHTATGEQSLVVVDQCNFQATHTPCQQLMSAANMPAITISDATTARAFLVRSIQPAITPIGTGSDTRLSIFPGVSYANREEFRPVSGGIGALSNQDPSATIFAQNRIVLDMDLVGNASFGIYNTTIVTGQIGGRWYHNWIRLVNCKGTTGANGRWGIDFDVLNTSNAVPSGTSQAAIAANNVITYEMSTGNTVRYGMGLNNIAANTKNNAYFGHNNSNTGRGGHTNDAGKVELVSAPVWGVTVAALQNAGAADLNGLGLRLSHDFNGKLRRTGGVPDIGPIEF